MQIWMLSLAMLASTLRIATPIIYAALGSVMSERGGVINIGIEGTMLLACFTAVVGAYYWSPWVGVLIAMATGGLMALIHAYLSVTIKTNQIISATAINIFAVGLPNLVVPIIWKGHHAVSPVVPRIPDVRLPIIANLPIVGPVLGHQNPLVYVALILVPVLHFILFKTRFGLRLRAVGEHPRAADTVGVNVARMRYIGVISGGILAGMGGAFLSIGYMSQYSAAMTQGRGFMGLAAMIFGNWKPAGALLACLIFGFADAFQAAAQSARVLPISPRLLLSLPYIMTLIALAGLVGKSIPPAADGKPYEKD